MNRDGSFKNINLLVYILSLAFFFILSFVVNSLSITLTLISWILTILPILNIYRSWAVVLELSLIPLLWLFFAESVSEHTSVWYLPVVSSTLFLLGYKLKSRTADMISLTAVVCWMIFAIHNAANKAMGVWEFIVILTTLAWVASYIIEAFRYNEQNELQNIDIIWCSYSGNTGHYLQGFIDSVKEVGRSVNVHRYHKVDKFEWTLEGDALVLAYPVSGWKPPWHFFEYLVTGLPRGKGKSAFILYTSAGGPENAAFAVWLVLTLKGYRVLGRLWSTYPMNVPTFRLGPKVLWRFLDSLTPLKMDSELLIKTAKEFAGGQRTGLPLIIWPTPLIIIGFVFENRWVNTLIYRAYAWRRRCSKCKFCIEYCPVNRFSTTAEVPKARGTCALCFGCVNHCPKSAMHLRFWTEYGQPYKTRWPEFVAKNSSK